MINVIFMIIAMLIVATCSYFAGAFMSKAACENMIREAIEEFEPTTYIPTPYPEYDYILPQEVLDMHGTEKEICMIAQTVWGEARGLDAVEQSKVIWCIFNRVDHPGFGSTIEEVIKSPGQFIGYKETNPIDQELYSLAKDTYLRWHCEKYYFVNEVGRTLDKDYLYFNAKDGKNVFRKEF